MEELLAFFGILVLVALGLIIIGPIIAVCAVGYGIYRASPYVVKFFGGVMGSKEDKAFIGGISLCGFIFIGLYLAIYRIFVDSSYNLSIRDPMSWVFLLSIGGFAFGFGEFSGFIGDVLEGRMMRKIGEGIDKGEIKDKFRIDMYNEYTERKNSTPKNTPTVPVVQVIKEEFNNPSATLVETALNELSDLVRSDNYGAIMFWAEKNAWVKRYDTLNTGLDKVVSIARKAHEIRDIGLEGEVKRTKLEAELKEAELRFEKAVKELDQFKNPPINKTHKQPKNRITTEEERIDAEVEKTTRRRQQIKDIREKLTEKGIPKEEHDDIIDDILNKLKFEEEPYK